MNSALERGIEAVRRLPEDRQEAVGEALLSLASQTRAPYELSPEQAAEVMLSIGEVERGEYAGDEEIAAFWKKAVA